MKTSVAPLVSKRFVRHGGVLVGLLFAIVAVALPFYSASSSSHSDRKQNISTGRLKMNSDRPSVLRRSGSLSTLTLSLSGESIAVFAADCVTPKDSFNLGEVICAKTDGVDLSTPGNYYVNFDGPNGILNGPTITQNPQYSLFQLPTNANDVGTWKANIGRVSPAESSIIGNPPLFTVSNGPAIGIFASNCTTPKSVFNLQDSDLTVCAKITGGDPSHYILWSNARFELVQSAPLGTGESTFTLTSGSSLGDWRVLVYEQDGGSVYAVTPFTVIDAANPSADITISKGSISATVTAGSQAVFTVQVTNLGPDSANVEITDSVPAHTTFYEFAATTAPIGTNCAKPAVGASSGDVVCTIPNLGRGGTAVFLGTYDVLSGVAANTMIPNTATITQSSVPDSHNANDSSTATVTVAGSVSETCTLDCPANVVVTADTTQGGQPGAFVTYGAASVTGSCGAVSNSPASGSFFTVGTHSVVSTSELGGASCNFTVTVLDTNPPTIMCPPDQTIQLSSGQTQATINPGTPTVNASGGGTVTGVRSDNQPATYDENGNVVTPAVIYDPYNDPYQIGSTGILWTVTDAGGRTASCSQTITVVAAGDRPPVTISCPANVSVTAPSGSCEATISAATLGTPTTNPSDSDIKVVGTRNDGRPLSDPFPAGVTIVTWTATDNTNGNVASCAQTVTVTAGSGSDTTPPVLTVPPNVDVTTSSCTATLDDELGTATATDDGACNGSVTITRTGVPTNFVFSTGTTTITYTATDAAGNTASGIQLVTVTESPAIPPTISAPADVILYTGPDATFCGVTVSNVDAALGTASASDNCPGVTVVRSGVPAGNTFLRGDTFITYTATDRSGNIASDVQKVTVVDNTKPTITLTGPNPQYVECHTSYSELGATATDNCDNVTATPSGTVDVNTPGTYTITYDASDTSGNAATPVQRTVIVQDTIPPTINLTGFAPSLWPPNHNYTTFQLTQFVASATDSCDTTLDLNDVVIEKVTSDEVENGPGDGSTVNDIVIAADCKSVQLRAERQENGDGRVYTITFKVRDASGNIGRATATVTVAKNAGETVVDSGVQYTVNGSCP